MTVQKQSIRAIIFHGEETETEGLSSYRLLSDLGHDVCGTSSTADALRLLSSGDADLLVIAPDVDESRLLDLLGRMPDDRLPREIAIVSDHLNEAAGRLRKHIHPARVHILLKPLHVHGLLNITRSLEADRAGELLH